jgi:hypothetical protein
VILILFLRGENCIVGVFGVEKSHVRCTAVLQKSAICDNISRTNLRHNTQRLPFHLSNF